MNLKGTLAVAVLAVFLALTFQPAYSLKCWTCSNFIGQGEAWCKDPFNQTEPHERLQECPPGLTHCVKIEATRKSDKAPFITRLCNQKELCDIYKKIGIPGIGEVKIDHCSVCDKHGCNDATNFGPAILLVPALAVVSMIIRA